VEARDVRIGEQEVRRRVGADEHAALLGAQGLAGVGAGLDLEREGTQLDGHGLVAEIEDRRRRAARLRHRAASYSHMSQKLR
jgi:hypothetical protein